MALSQSTRFAGPFIAIAGQTDFDCSFPVIDTDGIYVQQVPVGTTEPHVLQLGTGFSIFDQTDSGFSVRLAAPCAAGDEVTPYSQLPVARFATIGAGAIDGPTLELGLVRITAELQEVRRDVDRAPKAPLGSAGAEASLTGVTALAAEAAASAAEADAAEAGAQAAAASAVAASASASASATTASTAGAQATTASAAAQAAAAAAEAAAESVGAGSSAWVDVAIAATTDLGAAASGNVRLIAGAGPIAHFGVTGSGVTRQVRVATAATLTYDAAAMILPGGLDIAMGVGDCFKATSLGSGNWLVVDYESATGRALKQSLADIVATGVLKWAPAATVASAATTDLSTAGSNLVNISGAAAITSFGAIAAGEELIVTFTGAPLLTYNNVSLILPGKRNIQAAAGDTMRLTSLGGGNVRVTEYVRAATPPPLPNAYATLAAATTMSLNAVQSATIKVTGQTTLDGNSTPAPITSLGSCAAGDPPRLLVFAAFNRFNCDGAHLVWKDQQFVSIAPGGSVLAIPTGTDEWTLQFSVDSQFVIKDAYWDEVGPEFTQTQKFGLQGHYTSATPDFLYNGAGVGDLRTTAIFIGQTQTGQGPQLGMWNADGTREAPVGVGAGGSGHRFSWVLDDTASWDCALGLQTQANSGGMNENQYFDYSGRGVEEIFGNYNASTQTDRSGFISWGISAPSQVSPVGHTALLPDGGRISYGVFGRSAAAPLWDYAASATASYEYPIPWADNNTRALNASPRGGRRGIFPAGWNPPETVSNANDMYLVADKANFGIHYYAPDPSFQGGWKFAYDSGADALAWGHLVAGATTWRVRLKPDGTLEPVTDGAGAIGGAAQRFGAVNALGADFNRDSSGTVLQVYNQSAAFSATDLLRMDTPNTAATTAANAIIVRAAGTPVARVDMTGKGFFNGGIASAGAGYGEMFEWADGNPEGEDRSGWSVCLDGDKIVRASTCPERPVVGVISRRLAHVGDAAIHHHHGKHQTDSFGRALTDPVEVVQWDEPIYEESVAHRRRRVVQQVTRPATEPAAAAQTVHQIVERDGRHCLEERIIQHPRERSVTELKPLHDADGRPLMIPVTRHAPDANGDLQPVLDEDGQPIVDQVHRHAHVPVMETIEQEVWEQYDEPVKVLAGSRHHSYRADAVPEGVAVPENAKRVTIEQPRVHPEHDAEQVYVAREDRAEWDGVSYLGKEFLLRGERTGANWILMRDADELVQEWLVFPPPAGVAASAGG